MSLSESLTDEMVRAALDGHEPEREAVWRLVAEDAPALVAWRLKKSHFNPLALRHDVKDIAQSVVKAVMEKAPTLPEATHKHFMQLVSRKRDSEVKKWVRRRHGIQDPRHLDSMKDWRSKMREVWGIVMGEYGSASSVNRKDEVLQRLISAREKLDPTNREILDLRFRDGLKAPAIAKRLGLKPGTVRKRKERSLKRLRQELRV